MARVTLRKPVTLPIPEAQLKAGQVHVLHSHGAPDTMYVFGFILNDDTRRSVRFRCREATSEQWLSGDLVERMPLTEKLATGEKFSFEVEALVDVLFVGALRCQRSFDGQS